MFYIFVLQKYPSYFLLGKNASFSKALKASSLNKRRIAFFSLIASKWQKTETIETAVAGVTR